MEVRLLSKPEEFEQAKINSAVAFNYTVDLDSIKDIKPDSDADSYGVFVQGQLVSHLTANNYQMMCHGGYVPMCGVGDVCSFPEHRNKGYVRHLFYALFDNLYKAGCVYSFLYPFSNRYYGKFGYGHGGCHIKAEIPLDRLKDYKCEYDVRQYRSGDSHEPYKEVFEKFASNYTGIVARNDWDSLSDYTPGKSNNILFLFTENDKPRAFLGLRNFQDQGGYLLAHRDAAWDSVDAFRNILGFLSRYRMHNNNINISLPQSFPVEVMLPEVWGVKLQRTETGQVRIIDTLRAMAAYPWADEKGELSIGVRDDYFTGQSGVYHICFGGGKTLVEKNGGAPDAEFDIRVLSPLLLGVYGFNDLEYFPPDFVNIVKNIPLLEKAFIRRPTFITEKF